MTGTRSAHLGGALRALRFSVTLVVAALAVGIPSTARAQPTWLAPVGISRPQLLLGHDDFDPEIALDAQGNATAIWWTPTSGGEGMVRSAVRPIGGTWSTPVDVSAPGASMDSLHVAVDGQGAATAVWARVVDPAGDKVIQSAYRPAGGAWSVPVDVSVVGPKPTDVLLQAFAYNPQVAVGGQGRATAVWARIDGAGNAVVQGAVRAADGTWAAPVDLSAAGKDSLEQQVVVDGQGTATAVWDRGKVVQSAVRPAGAASSWSSPVDLSAAGAEQPAVAADGEGAATAVWVRSGPIDGARIVQSSFRPAGGAWSAPADLSVSSQDARFPAVAVDGHGTATAVWVWGPQDDSVVQSSVRPAAGPWSDLRNVSAGGLNAYASHVVVDGEGTATAVWLAYPGPLPVVQSSTRPAGDEWSDPVNLSGRGPIGEGE